MSFRYGRRVAYISIALLIIPVTAVLFFLPLLPDSYSRLEMGIISGCLILALLLLYVLNIRKRRCLQQWEQKYRELAEKSGQDMSQRRQIEDLLITSEKMVMVGGLAAGMAHELNNPLGIVLQNLQNIQRRISRTLPANARVAESVGLDLERLHRYLDERGIIRMLDDTFSAGARAADIIAGMLKFSRRAGSKHEAVLLPDLLESTIHLASCDYELKKIYNFMSITIIRDYDDQLPAIRMCRQEIEQMLFNLLKNAAQAVAGNPQDRPPKISIKTIHENSWAIIEVGDNGTGMSEDICKRIFEPFFTTREVGSGPGLGLSIAYAIVVNNHHGSISVSSAPGEGSLFTIRLPLVVESVL